MCSVHLAFLGAVGGGLASSAHEWLLQRLGAVIAQRGIAALGRCAASARGEKGREGGREREWNDSLGPALFLVLHELKKTKMVCYHHVTMRITKVKGGNLAKNAEVKTYKNSKNALGLLK